LRRVIPWERRSVPPVRVSVPIGTILTVRPLQAIATLWPLATVRPIDTFTALLEPPATVASVSAIGPFP